jgi:hypothetical protein
MAVVGVVSSPKSEPKDRVSGLKEYGPDLVRLEPNFSPTTIDERREYVKVETRLFVTTITPMRRGTAWSR